MGYYANSTEGEITILAENFDKALEAIVEAYTKLNEKSNWGQMPIPKTLEEAIEDDFEYDLNDTNLTIPCFDGKWTSYIEPLFEALLSVATPDSAMSFRGEDGEMWRMTPTGTQTAKIIWE
jgi:hypothetical protein